VKLGAAVPVPLRATLCGEPAALSVIESEAEKPAVDDGAKVTEMVQLAAAARDSPHVFVWLKLLEFVPVMAMPLILSEAWPVLLSVTVCAPLVAPFTAEKLSDVGVSETTGAGTTAEKFAVTDSAALMVMVVEALDVLATLPVQLLKV
jgi:hypothetical protein